MALRVFKASLFLTNESLLLAVKLWLSTLVLAYGANGRATAVQCGTVFSGQDSLQIQSAEATEIGPQWRQWQYLEKYGNTLQQEGFVVVFRGQTRLTPSVISNAARKEGIEGSEHLLSEILKSVAEMRELNTKRDPTGPISVLTDLQLATIQHTDTVLMPSPFVATSGSAKQAAGGFNGGTYVRFVYVMKVPLDKAIDVTPVHRSGWGGGKMFLEEQEIVIPHDATPYIVGVADLETGIFYDAKTFRRLSKRVFESTEEDANERNSYPLMTPRLYETGVPLTEIREIVRQRGGG